jgi:hypothetical protein
MHRDSAFGPEHYWWMSRGWGGNQGRGFGGGPRGGRPWWAEAMGEPPPRAERGGVRFLVLEAIAEQPRHGYEIIQHIEQRATSPTPARPTTRRIAARWTSFMPDSPKTNRGNPMRKILPS